MLRAYRVAAIALLLGAASAHELEENRATLVLRDRTHLSLTIYLSYPEALHQALAPSRPFPAFLVAFSSLDQEKLRQELRVAQARFESETHVYLPDQEATLTNWVWPDPAAVQAMLQRRVMQALVDPAAHTHEPPVEVRADLVSPREVMSARVRFPASWRKVLLVRFRPGQQWVEGKAVSAEMAFPAEIVNKE